MHETTAVARTSQEESSEIATALLPEGERRFHCSQEWHFTKMKSKIVFFVYSWGRGLSFKSKSFYPSAKNIADHLGFCRTAVLAALKEMVELGWAEVLNKEPGRPVQYRFVSHKEWAAANPGCCTVKDSSPWEHEKHDLLAQRLRNVAGGNVHFLKGQMKGLRESGLSDDQIETAFRAFLERNPHKGKEWKRVYYHFHGHLFLFGKAFGKDNPVPAAILRNANSADDADSVGDNRNDQSFQKDYHQSFQNDHTSRFKTTTTSRSQATQVFEVEFPKKGIDGRAGYRLRGTSSSSR